MPLALSRALAIAFGVLLFAQPDVGALTLAIWIGAYALLSGVLLIAVSFRLRRWGRDPSRRHRRRPPTESHAHA